MEQASAAAATGTGVVLSPHYGDHDTGAGHPESAALIPADLDQQTQQLAAQPLMLVGLAHQHREHWLMAAEPA